MQEGDLVGKCRIIRLLGSGGMGTVYLALHTMLDSEVALKVVSPALVRDNPALAARFVREAQVAARIRHPHVVSVMDADTDLDSGLSYLVLEYLPGGSLADKLKDGPLSEVQAVRIVREIAEALRVASANHIAHRDIKPGNILFTSDGSAKLADLGLARILDAPAVNVTQDGAAIGTPAYMSPQHVRDARAADGQDDLYSLGATFFEMLTGRVPFLGDTPYNVISAILSQPTPEARKLNPKVSASASAICRKLMARDKKERYASAEFVLRDLQAWQRGETPEALREMGRNSRRIRSRTGLESVSNWKDRAFLLGSMAFCFLVVYTFRSETRISEKPQPPLASSTSAPALPAVPAPHSVEIRKAEPVVEPLPILPDGVPPTPALDNPDPTGPAPGSLQDVRKLADLILPPDVKGKLLQAFGLRSKDCPLPINWRLFYYDPSARQHVRAVTVENLHVKEVVDGFVELRKLRLAAYKATEVVNLARVVLDSPQALSQLLTLEDLQGVVVAESSFELNAPKREDEPFWKINLYAKRDDEMFDLGWVRLSAETGKVMENHLDYDHIEKVRVKIEPLVVP